VEQRSNYGTRSIIAPLLPNTQVLAWLGRRKTDAEIALIFGRSARTVKSKSSHLGQDWRKWASRTEPMLP
jgi:hypothetical protein